MRGAFSPKATKDTDAQNPERWFLDWLGGGAKSSSGITVTQHRAMQDLTFMACVSARSGDLAKCPIHVYRRRSNGAHVIEKNNPLERVLRRPNSWQTRMEFVEQLQSALLLKSNAYAAIRWDGRGAPVELIPIWPDRVMVYENGGDLFYKVTSNTQHERAQLRGFLDPIPAADMLHLRWLSFNGILGLSRIHLARDALGLSLALGEHSSRLFANGTRPGGHFQTDKRLSDPIFSRFKAQLEDYRGVENFGKNLILEEGLKWQAEAMTAVESQTIEARRFQAEQIAMACDVPLHRLGIIQDKDAAILQAQQMYRNNTLSGDAERWEAKLDRTFGLDGEELFTAFDLDYFNRADIQTRMTAYRTGVIGTMLTPNEARRKEGLPDDPDGNVLLQPANVVPLGTMPSTPNPSGPGSDVTGAPAPGGDGDPAAVPALD